MAPSLVSTRCITASARPWSSLTARSTPLSRASATFRPTIRRAGLWAGVGTEPLLRRSRQISLTTGFRARRPPFSWTQFDVRAGPAADESGNLVFVTGNSAASTWTDNVPCTGTATGSVPTSVPCSNIQESVVKLKGDLTAVTGLFSPNALYGTFSPDTTQLTRRTRILDREACCSCRDVAARFSLRTPEKTEDCSCSTAQEPD